MSKTGKRGVIRAIALMIAAVATVVAAGVASAHPSPAAHHALADNGVLHMQ